MEPINYMGLNPQVNPLGNLLQGLQAGQALSQVRDQAIARQQAQQQQEEFRTDFTDYLQAPSYDKLVAMQVKHPLMAERIKPLTANMDKKQLQSDLTATYQSLASIESGRPDIALSTIDKYIEANKNSGLDTSKLEQIKTAITQDPTSAATHIEAMAGIIDPEAYKKFTESRAKRVETTQSEILFPEVQAQKALDTQIKGYDAAIKSEEAKLAPQKLQADYNLVQEKIKDSQLGRQLDKQRVQIAAITAAAARESNGIKRQELGLQLAKKQQDFIKDVSDRQAAGETSMSFIGNAKSLVKEILSDPSSLRAVTGTLAFKGAIPGTVNRAMVSKIDQLVNILASANKDVLKGPTSDKDIAFLKNISSNLTDRYQDEDEYIKNIYKVSKLLDKNEAVISKQYGIKPTGTDATSNAKAIPDTPPSGAVRRIK